MRALILLAFAAVALAQPIPQQPVTCTGTPATCTFPAGSSVKVGNTFLAQAASGADIGAVVNALLTSNVQVTIVPPAGGGAYLVTTPIVLTNLTNASLICAAGVTLTGNTASALVTVAGGTKIAVSGCIMNGNSTSANGVLATGTSSAPLTDLTVADNQIYGTTAQAVNVYASGAYSLSFSALYPGLFVTNVKVLRNTLHDTGDANLYINRVNTALVDGNTVYNPSITTAQVTGTINTSGTAVSSSSVSLTGITSGAGITIAGTIYYFASVPSGTSGTLTASAGTQTGAAFTSTSGPLGQPLNIFFTHSRNVQISHNTVYGLANFTIQPENLNADPGGIHGFVDIGDLIFGNSITGNCTVAANNCPYVSSPVVGQPQGLHIDTDYNSQVNDNVASNLYVGFMVEGGLENGTTANTATDMIYRGIYNISRNSFSQVNTFDSISGVTAGGNTTLTLDTTHFKQGTGSLKAVTGSGFTGAALLWCYSLGSVTDFNQYPTARMDMLATGANVAGGKLQLIVSTSSNCSSPWGAFDIPQLVAGTWVQWQFPFQDPSMWQAPASGGPAGVQSFGVQVIASGGLPSATLNFDDLQMLFPHEHIYSHANHTARTGDAGIGFYGPFSFFESKGDQVSDFGTVGTINASGVCGAVCYSSTVSGDQSDHFTVTDLTALVRAGIFASVYPVSIQMLGNSTSNIDAITVQNILSPGGTSANTFWQAWTSTAPINYYFPSGATYSNVIVGPGIGSTAACLAAISVTTPCQVYNGTFTGLGVSGTTGTITLYTSSAPSNGVFQICPFSNVNTPGSGGNIESIANWTSPGSAVITNYNFGSVALNNYGANVNCYSIATKQNTTLTFSVQAVSGTGTPSWETAVTIMRLQ